MRPARRDTRAEILSLAEQLFHARGYHGFSYQDIAQALGVKNAAIHYHFASKEDLGLALIGRLRELVRKNLELFRGNPIDPVAAIQAYFGYYRNHCAATHSICAVGMLAAELSTVPDAMRLQARALADEMRELLAAILEAGRARGVMQFAGEPAARALSLMCTMGGAAQVTRLKDSPEVLETVIAQVSRELGLAA
ncbi:MAG: TetR/AcrR family transcriptional regulator [Gammaproteobacteria bacterium]|nr:TetR/AcrR family transcriptional regulator [Gammaproteobacteria bacterium]